MTTYSMAKVTFLSCFCLYFVNRRFVSCWTVQDSQLFDKRSEYYFWEPCFQICTCRKAFHIMCLSCCCKWQASPESYLEGELFIKDRFQCVLEHFGLAGFSFVGTDVNLDVGVRASPQVHGFEAVGLFDPHGELKINTDRLWLGGRTGSSVNTVLCVITSVCAALYSREYSSFPLYFLAEP